MIHSTIAQGSPIILCDSQYPSQIEIATYALIQGYKVHIFAPGFLESEVCNPLDFLRDSSDAETATLLGSIIQRNFYLGTKDEEGRRQEAEGRRENCRGIQTRQQSNTAKTNFSRGLEPLLPPVVAEDKVQSPPASCPLPSAFSDNADFFHIATEQLIGAILMLTLEFGEMADIMTAAAILKSEQMVQRLIAADLKPWIKIAFGQLFSCGSSSKTAASIVSNTSFLFNHFLASPSVGCFIGKTTLPQETKRKQLIVFGLNPEINQAVAPLIWSALLLLLSRHIAESKEHFTLALDPLARNYLTKYVSSSTQVFINSLAQQILLPQSRNKVEEFDWRAYKNLETFSYIKEFETRARLVEQKFPLPK